MCELLVSFSDIVSVIFICIIDLCWPGDTGLEAFAFVKFMKRLMGISFKNGSVLEENRTFAIKWLFLPFSILVFGWNLAEFAVLHNDRDNDSILAAHFCTFLRALACLQCLPIYRH